MACWHDYAINGITFIFFWIRFGCAWFWLAERFLQKWRWLFFFIVATRLSCKTMCTITAKQHKCRFLVLERNVKKMAAGFETLTFVKTSRFIGWNENKVFICTCWTIHNSNSLLYFVFHTHIFLSIFGWLKSDIE